ncbi:hypothetical protein SARC_10836 [Sphaeroforma arctica JP610]|uniref:Glycoside-hydrolase family GH114 TIM-barrel domain-containing protein n=1 Tax=Sphaeroforma arctica JP610 TaxID=667725 RepID=A0A0L0FKZ3_9EUKA|nr:hypothetical protein SARC_10836 [Sphaeroforma arctica JP610]KNC76678.1 hypothetical protein SARC_10836 [Sphaeroforma arctica JP610]|eukprot:XP_014150580.1 hypothetical protein SARC_10836 [Sphaeroforma arctica JP610]
MKLNTQIFIAATILASIVTAAPMRKDAETSIICNLAWANSEHALDTDCTGADIIFADPSIPDARVSKALKDHSVDIMAYLSVGTVNPEYTPDDRLVALAWKQNKDKNSEGDVWGDWFFNTNDLIPKVLPIMEDIISSYKERGFTMISTDNAKPSTGVTDNNTQSKSYADKERIDPRYVAYMQEIVKFAHSIGLKVTLKNPSYYVNEPAVVNEFDAYIIESMFNYYPWDVDTHESLLYTQKPLWLFQYPGINHLTKDMLDEMKERNIHLVYMDSPSGYHQFRV